MRALVCLGVVLALTTALRADDKEAKFMKAKIVKVDADGGTLTVRGDDNKEHQLKVPATARILGADKQPLAGGLKADAFKEGADVWYRTGTGTEATSIAELRFSDPGA